MLIQCSSRASSHAPPDPAEIILDLTMNGNIDSLEMVFAFDLDVVILGFDNYCSDYFPDECPLTFIDTTIDFGDFCPSAKKA